MLRATRVLAGVIVGFVAIYLGSIEIPGHVLPLVFGPYPEMGSPPFIRTLTDFFLSAALTVLGGYVAALVAGSWPLIVALTASALYLALSLLLYLSYGLTGSEWIWPFFMLLKVPLSGLLGGWIFARYNNSLNTDAGSAGAG